MQYRNIHPKINEYDNYRLYLAAQSLITRYVHQVPFLLSHLEETTKLDIQRDLHFDSNQYYVIYNSYLAKLMQELGEPISNRLLYPIWQRRYTNESIIDDLVFQKIEAHEMHKIPFEELRE